MKKEIKGKGYQVVWEPEKASLVFKGSLSLMGSNEYAPIARLMEEAAQNSDQVLLDLQGLKFLNSAGINIIYRFVIKLRDTYNPSRVVVRGTHQVNWQAKSLQNLTRLMPALQMEWV